MAQRIDKYTSVKKKTEVYSDFFTNFDVHPNTNQIVRVVNEEAVKKSLRNLLLTNKYERLINPSIGSNIKKLLFEPISSHTTLQLRTYIMNTIETYEPRAKVVDLQLIPSPDQNAYFIQLVFYVTTITNQVSLNLSLKRVR